MAPTATYNDKGFTLVELLIAIFLITVSMFAVLTSMVTSIKMNVENDIRNTAVRLTNQTAETLLALQWADVGGLERVDSELTGDLDGVLHERGAANADQDAKGLPALTQSVRNFRQDYRIQWVVEDLPPLPAISKRITITVSYTRTGQELSNVAVIFRHRRV